MESRGRLVARTSLDSLAAFARSAGSREKVFSINNRMSGGRPDGMPSLVGGSDADVGRASPSACSEPPGATRREPSFCVDGGDARGWFRSPWHAAVSSRSSNVTLRTSLKFGSFAHRSIIFLRVLVSISLGDPQAAAIHQGSHTKCRSQRDFPPVYRIRQGGTVEACHWLGQCFGDNFCKVTRFVDIQLERQPHKGTASPFDVSSLFLPTRAKNVNTHAALAKAVAPNFTSLRHCHPAGPHRRAGAVVRGLARHRCFCPAPIPSKKASLELAVAYRAVGRNLDAQRAATCDPEPPENSRPPRREWRNRIQGGGTW